MSRAVLETLAGEQNCGIITNGDHAYLDNGTVQAESSSTDQDDMASKFRRTYTYTDEAGKQTTYRLNGKDDADTDLQFQRICGGDQKSKKDVPTFKQFAEDVYIPHYVKIRKATTNDTDTWYIRKYMYPVFGDKRLDDATNDDAQFMMDRLAHGTQYGYQANMVCGTIDRVVKLLQRIFSIAVSKRIIADNPIELKLLVNRGKPSEHHKALSDAEIARVKEMIPSLKMPRQQMYMALIAYCGLRPEEAIGMTWDRIDLEKGCALVTQVVTYAGTSKRAVVNATGKTENAKRLVILPQACKDILARYQKASGYVLHGKDENAPMPYSTWDKFTASASLKQLGIYGKYSSYDFRSTFCTNLLESGATSKQAADLMGHGDTRMVETVYAPARQEGIMKLQGMIEQMNAKYATP